MLGIITYDISAGTIFESIFSKTGLELVSLYTRYKNYSSIIVKGEEFNFNSLDDCIKDFETDISNLKVNSKDSELETTEIIENVSNVIEYIQSDDIDISSSCPDDKEDSIKSIPKKVFIRYTTNKINIISQVLETFSSDQNYFYIKLPIDIYQVLSIGNIYREFLDNFVNGNCCSVQFSDSEILAYHLFSIKPNYGLCIASSNLSNLVNETPCYVSSNFKTTLVLHSKKLQILSYIFQFIEKYSEFEAEIYLSKDINDLNESFDLNLEYLPIKFINLNCEPIIKIVIPPCNNKHPIFRCILEIDRNLSDIDIYSNEFDNLLFRREKFIHKTNNSIIYHLDFPRSQIILRIIKFQNLIRKHIVNDQEKIKVSWSSINEYTKESNLPNGQELSSFLNQILINEKIPFHELFSTVLFKLKNNYESNLDDQMSLSYNFFDFNIESIKNEKITEILENLSSVKILKQVLNEELDLLDCSTDTNLNDNFISSKVLSKINIVKATYVTTIEKSVFSKVYKTKSYNKLQNPVTLDISNYSLIKGLVIFSVPGSIITNSQNISKYFSSINDYFSADINVILQFVVKIILENNYSSITIIDMFPRSFDDLVAFRGLMPNMTVMINFRAYRPYKNEPDCLLSSQLLKENRNLVQHDLLWKCKKLGLPII